MHIKMRNETEFLVNKILIKLFHLNDGENIKSSLEKSFNNYRLTQQYWYVKPKIGCDNSTYSFSFSVVFLFSKRK